MGSAGIAKILIIEDEPSFRTFYSDMLNMAGYQVLEAEDGEAGWALVQSEKPGMILLDLIMPKLGGLEVLKKIRGNDETKEIPVIIMSADKNEWFNERALKAGAVGFLQKPFTDQALIDFIKVASEKEGSTSRRRSSPSPCSPPRTP